MVGELTNTQNISSTETWDSFCTMYDRLHILEDIFCSIGFEYNFHFWTLSISVSYYNSGFIMLFIGNMKTCTFIGPSGKDLFVPVCVRVMLSAEHVSTDEQ